MKTRLQPLVTGSVLVGSLFFLSGCASTDEGGSSQVSAGVYYGTSFYDPWYYGADYPPDVVVTPPPNRPVDPPHVEHPIATPPAAPPPVARPMPSIPSMPRPAFRR